MSEEDCEEGDCDERERTDRELGSMEREIEEMEAEVKELRDQYDTAKRLLEYFIALLGTDEELRNWGAQTVEPDPFGEDFDYYEASRELVTQIITNGDRVAARKLVNAATFYGWGVEFCLKCSEFSGGKSEGIDELKRIAESRLQWPCVVSRHRRFNVNSGSVAEYLEKLNLGGRKNLNTEKIDSRSARKAFAINCIFGLVENSLGERLVRAGLERDEWLSSEHGKAVKIEIAKLLDSLFQNDDWMTNPLLSPMVEAATKKASTHLRYRDGLEPGAPVEPTVQAIKSALIKDACSLIHGMLRD